MFPMQGNQPDDKLYADDVFSTFLYTGSGSTLAINNGIDLAGKGGMVWLKRRSGSDSHYLWDTARGQNNFLSTDLVNAQSSSPGQMTFGSSGFTLGGGAFVNGSDVTFSSWTFREAPKFFDVVTYTGTGANPQTYTHGLGVEPGLILFKSTTTSVGWVVYSKNLGLTSGRPNCLFLDLVDAEAAGSPIVFPSVPTASSFSVGPANGTGASGVSYVAYLFADDPSADGLIRSGSFTTDGSGNASVTTLGWEPQFLLVKASSTTGDWIMLDSMRGWNMTANDAKLIANGTAAESTTTEYGNPTATGFDFKGGSASATYVYMAIRRPNKPPTSGDAVFNLSGSAINGGSIAGVTGTSNPSLSGARRIDAVIRAFTGGDSRNFEVFDRLRGFQTSSTFTLDGYTSPRLSTSSTGQEVVTSTDVYQRTGLSGFEDYVAYASATTNTVQYALKRAPGFFDVVCYTGDGLSTRVVDHSLTVTPEVIFIKPLSGAGAWLCAFRSSGTDYYTPVSGSPGTPFGLNTANGGGLVGLGSQINATTFRTSTMALSSGITGVNENGVRYVAYLFASLPGISKVGTYTGNGTSRTINCGFSTGARFVLIKRAGSTGDWYVWDTARGISSGNDPHLSLNGTAAEVSTDDSVDPDGSGFVVNQVAATNINVSAATFLYLAIA